MTTVTTRQVRINHTFNQFFGGYRDYWRLYAQLIATMKQSKSILKGLIDALWQVHSDITGSPVKRPNAFLTGIRNLGGLLLFIAVQTPYFLFLKPLGSLFAVTTKFNGDFRIDNNRLVKSDVVKWTIVNIVFAKANQNNCWKIPFFAFYGTPSKKDWKEVILKDDTVIL